MPAPTARHPVGFLSYVHADDEADEGRLTQFRIRLEREIRVQTGTELTIFQDRQDIRWGQEWRRRIESSIDGMAFLIPILTPSFFMSEQCRQEFDRFLQHEHELRRSDLIFPVYYVSCRALDEPGKQGDHIASVLAERQYTDWRDLRFEALTSPKAARRVAELAQHLGAALLRDDSHAVAAPAGRLGAEPARMAAQAGALFSASDGADIGLVKVFPSFDDCQAEILTQVRESLTIKIFVQMGKSVLSGAAIIYEALEHSKSEAEIKILHAGSQNPYLSERVALKRSSDYGEWREDIRHATRKADWLQGHLGARLELRRHSEGYVWRIFLFDNYVYLQPYLYPRDNSHKAPVLKFDRCDAMDPEAENVRSLYHMFRTYFDLKWEEYTPEARRLGDLIGPGETAAVAAFVVRGGVRVFVVPKRFVAREGEELPFHNIGGKRNLLEDWEDALQREALEEIGTRLSVKSCRSTRDITTSAEFEPLVLSDSPGPYCVYKRTRVQDPEVVEVVEEEVLWIVGYEAELPADAAIEPRTEIAAIVLLSPDMLGRTARERITYDQIRRARDGSGVLLQAGVDLDFQRVAVPAGLAALPIFSAQAASLG